jgi:deoxyribonuclease-1
MSRIGVFSYILLLLFITQTHATVLRSPQKYYPDDFYSRVEDGLRDDGLKSALQEVLTSWHQSTPEGHDRLVRSCRDEASCYKHISLGYHRAREILFGEIHLQNSENGYSIFDVYCERTLTKRDFHGRPPGPDQIPDPTTLNAEHTWPQSRFVAGVNREMQKSDLHILYPVLSEANSSRGNIEFSDVVTPVSSPCAKSTRGYAQDGSGQLYFEVPDAHKGNVARAIMYFATHYRARVSPQEESSLKAWHRLDPVDEFERKRNEAIFKKQRVRNPFIDHPELVELISDF